VKIEDASEGESRDKFDASLPTESIIMEVERLQKRTAELEKALNHEKRKSQKLKEMFKDGEQPLRMKMSQLDRHLEQLTTMYHKLVSQNSAMKVECQVNEKKIQRKEQRITILEKTLQDSRDKYERLLSQCTSLTAAVEQLHASGCTTLSARSPSDGKVIVPMRKLKISKPLRGGGNNAAKSPTAAQ